MMELSRRRTRSRCYTCYLARLGNQSSLLAVCMLVLAVAQYHSAAATTFASNHLAACFVTSKSIPQRKTNGPNHATTRNIKSSTSFPISASSVAATFSVTRLYQQQDGENEIQRSDRPGTARFMNPMLDSGGMNNDATSTLDSILTLLSSDLVSVALGAIGLLIIVVHRLTLLDDSITASTQALAEQTRTDLLAVFACGSVLLNGITKLDVTSALSESVVLQGIKLESPEILQQDNSINVDTIQWGLNSLLSATPAQSAVILKEENDGWKIQARAGILPPNGPKALVPPEAGQQQQKEGRVELSTPILDRVGSSTRNPSGKETYLPTLQALPGRFEFVPYLPSNTQLVLMVPIFNTGRTKSSTNVLVLGSNTAKSFSPRDVAWSRVIAERMLGG